MTDARAGDVKGLVAELRSEATCGSMHLYDLDLMSRAANALERLSTPQGTVGREDALAVALSLLASRNVPVDVQELLLHGNPSLGVAPGALADLVALLPASDSALREENEQLKAEVASKSEQIGKLYKICNEATVLRNANERMRKALETVDAWIKKRHYIPKIDGVQLEGEPIIGPETQKVFTAVTAALSASPSPGGEVAAHPGAMDGDALRRMNNLAVGYLNLEPEPASDPGLPASEAEGAESSIDFQQRRGVAWDLVDEALNQYQEFMLDDDYDYQRALTSIMERLQARRDIYLADSSCAQPLPTERDRAIEECACYLNGVLENWRRSMTYGDTAAVIAKKQTIGVLTGAISEIRALASPAPVREGE